MTRQLVIVNMSNGDNEDFHAEGVYGKDGKPNALLRPGEFGYVVLDSNGDAKIEVKGAVNQQADAHAHTYRNLNIEVEGAA